jgi:hypothetical protein
MTNREIIAKNIRALRMVQIALWGNRETIKNKTIPLMMIIYLVLVGRD